MTQEQINLICTSIANKVTGLYAKACESLPKTLVLVGMTGALAACVAEAGMDRKKIISALNSAFDDIEGIDEKDDETTENQNG